MVLSAELKPQSSEFIKLVTKGRVTNLPHIVLVRFANMNGSFFVLTGRSRSDWTLNALNSRRARVRMQELVYDVSVEEASVEEREGVLENFIDRYGSRVVRAWYPGSPACLRLTPLAPPSTRGTVRGEAETRLNFSEWKVKNLNYYDGVASAFDSAAEEYDFTINQNFINRWIRQRSLEELMRLTRSEDTLLEIGCGTGAEAIEISRGVSRIIATDISEAMIRLLEMKIKARRLEGKITPFKLRASEIAKASSVLGGQKIRVAYSLNGALNCEPEIDSFPRNLAGLLEDEGYFVCSIRNTLCLSEFALHALALQFGKMSPRKKRPIMVSVGGMDIPSYYYSPSELIRLFSADFRLRRLIALPAILPPAYLSDRYVKVRRVVGFVERLEKNLSRLFPLNRFGDQSLFVFQKAE